MNKTTASRRLVNINVFRVLAQLMWNSRLSPEALARLRVKKLRRVLVHAYEHHEFYRIRMSAAGFDPYACRSVEDLERLPVLDRETYRNFVTSEECKDPVRYGEYFRDSTSGSTGKPLPVIRSWGERAYMLAKFLRLLYLNGYRPGDVMYWIASPVHVRKRDTLLQSLGIMKRHTVPFSEPTDVLVQKLVDTRPSVIFANKSHLVQMAMYISSHDITIRCPRLCISVGETMDQVSLTLIQNVFGSSGIVDAYGSLEMSNLAYRRISEVEEFEFNHDTDILEVVDDAGQRCNHGTALVTDLHIDSFPLIRYQIGDRIDVEYRNGLPAVTRIVGRMDDLITLRDGRTFSGPMLEVIMEEHPEILQYRVIQESYDLLRIVIATGSGCDRQRLDRVITQSVNRHISKDVTAKCEFVDAIPPDANGKLRMLVSKVRN